MIRRFFKNYYMLCDITLKGKGRHFVIPVPLFLLDGVLDGWWLFKPFVKYIPSKKIELGASDIKVDLKDITNVSVDTLRKVWNNFRHCGRIELVNVETNEVKVKVKLL